MHEMERGDVSGQSVALAAMVVAIVALLVVLVVRLTSSGDDEATSPSPTDTGGGAASVFPAAGRAADASTQSDLRNAMAAALVYFTDSTTFAGFTAATASSIEPSVRYTDGGPASPGAVSIRAPSATGIVLVEKSASGRVFCIANIAAAGPSTVEGQTDAATPESCTGGW